MKFYGGRCPLRNLKLFENGMLWEVVRSPLLAVPKKVLAGRFGPLVGGTCTGRLTKLLWRTKPERLREFLVQQSARRYLCRCPVNMASQTSSMS